MSMADEMQPLMAKACFLPHIGSATVERWFQDYLRREDAERKGVSCPRVLGIDEHFFSRKEGYATTFCDLGRHTIFDVVLGRSEAALEEYLAKLPSKERVAGSVPGSVQWLSGAGAQVFPERPVRVMCR